MPENRNCKNSANIKRSPDDRGGVQLPFDRGAQKSPCVSPGIQIARVLSRLLGLNSDIQNRLRQIKDTKKRVLFKYLYRVRVITYIKSR